MNSESFATMTMAAVAVLVVIGAVLVPIIGAGMDDKTDDGTITAEPGAYVNVFDFDDPAYLRFMQSEFGWTRILEASQLADEDVNIPLSPGKSYLFTDLYNHIFIPVYIPSDSYTIQYLADASLSQLYVTAPNPTTGELEGLMPVRGEAFEYGGDEWIYTEGGFEFYTPGDTEHMGIRCFCNMSTEGVELDREGCTTGTVTVPRDATGLGYNDGWILSNAEMIFLPTGAKIMWSYQDMDTYEYKTGVATPDEFPDLLPHVESVRKYSQDSFTVYKIIYDDIYLHDSLDSYANGQFTYDYQYNFDDWIPFSEYPEPPSDTGGGSSPSLVWAVMAVVPVVLALAVLVYCGRGLANRP